ncbi:Uncharacterised protein g3440 [Pycnogonum litorale]
MVTLLITASSELNYSRESTVALTGPVFILKPPSSVEFLITDGVRLDCLAHGEPDPSVMWYSLSSHGEQKKVTDVPSLRRVFDNGSLWLMSFAAEQYQQDVHASTYRCTASNTYGRIISSPVSVRAAISQQVQAKVYDEYVISGNTAVMTCHVPTFYKEFLRVKSWIREDNFIIRTNYLKSTRYTVTTSGKLHIHNVNNNDLETSYWCQVENKLNKETFLSQTSGKVILTRPQGGVVPRIIDIMPEVTVDKGNRIQLPCVAQGYPTPAYSWYIHRKDKFKVLRKNRKFGNLYIDPNSDNKIYSKTITFVCEASNNIGEHILNTTVVIKEPLKVYITPQFQIVDYGHPAHFQCKISGYPIVKIIWTKDGVELSKKIVKSVGLTVSSVKQSDEGMYQCFVSNNEITKQATAQLQLGNTPPFLIKTFEKGLSQPGLLVEFECRASGKPRPIFTWSLNSVPVKPENNVQIKTAKLNETVSRSRLTVRNIQRDTSGEFTCSAANKFGRVNYSNSYQVYGLPKVRSMQNLTVVAGQDVTVRCFVVGYPIESTTWERAGRYMPLNSRTFENGTLIIQKVEPGKDDGLYTCTANNNKGHTSTEHIWIKAVEKPLIGEISVPNRVELGHHLTLVCTIVKGDEPVTILWKKDGSPLSSDVDVDFTEAKKYSLLQIRSVKRSHSGNYTCVAQNPAGVETHTVHLEIAVPPEWLIEPPEKIAIKVNSSALIDCRATGFPSPSSKWIKIIHGGYQRIQSNKMYHVYTNGSMLIKQAQNKISGRYRCVVSNDVVPDLVKEVFVRVGYRPSVATNGPVVKAKVGVNVLLKCKEQKNRNYVSSDSVVSWILKNSTNGRLWKLRKKDQTRIRIAEGENNSTLDVQSIILEYNKMEIICNTTNMFGSTIKHFVFNVTDNRSDRIIPAITTSTDLSIPDLTEVTDASVAEDILTTVVALPDSQFDISTTNIDSASANVITDGSEDKSASLLEESAFISDTHNELKTINHSEEMVTYVGTGMEKIGGDTTDVFSYVFQFIIPVSIICIVVCAVLITILAFVWTRVRDRSQKENADNDAKRSTECNNQSSSLSNDQNINIIEPRYGRLRNTSASRSKAKHFYEIPNYDGLSQYGTLNRQNNNGDGSVEVKQSNIELI